MNKFILFFGLFIITASGQTATDENVNIYGRIKTLDENTVVLATEDAKVSIPRKLMKVKAKVGEKISIEIPKESFKEIKSQPLKK